MYVRSIILFEKSTVAYSPLGTQQRGLNDRVDLPKHPSASNKDGEPDPISGE